MTVDGRDRLVVQLVARFNQLASAHLDELVFANLASHTPASRTLRRLVERRYLSRIERRTVGGSRGGSGQYVYQLGPLGHAMFRAGRYTPARAINYHSLAIADAYLVLVRLQRAGLLNLRGYSTEPDCWVTIGRYDLKPDMYVELERPDGEVQKLWLEIDMGSEGQRQIKGKFERYWKALNAASEDEWPVFPLVLFIGVDAYRAQELQWLLDKEPAEMRELFHIVEADKFGSLFQD